jgi:copper chaperone
MKMLKLKVPDMTCGHCVSTVEKAIKAVDARASVKTDLASKTVTVDSSAAVEAISKAIDGAGYPNTAA